MRILNLYCVVDTRAKTIIGPVVHDYSAVPIIRQATEAVNKPGTPLHSNPEDYAVVCIGQIDEETGNLLDADQNPLGLEVIAQVLALKRTDP